MRFRRGVGLYGNIFLSHNIFNILIVSPQKKKILSLIKLPISIIFSEVSDNTVPQASIASHDSSFST